MKKTIIGLVLCGIPMVLSAQHTFDALQLSQTELRGSSRFMSMGGAFGALGGDISVLNQNPGGLGVYRSSDLGVTLSLDFNKTQTPGVDALNDTKFNFNNFGYIGALKLDSEVMPNLNWGVSYNRINSFNRRYKGAALNIPTSVTNYIADQANADGMTTNILDPATGSAFFNSNGGAWNQVLAYSNYLINPTTPQGTNFAGLGYDGVVGDAEFDVFEKGHTDEFSVGIGGNIANTMYWGMALGVTDLVYEYDKYYGESLGNTVIYDRCDDPEAQLVDGNVNLGFEDFSRTTGTGYNFKLGVIFKPVNALRLGLAFHTPTYYDMKDTYTSYLATEFYGENVLDNRVPVTDQYGSYMEGSYTLNDQTPTNTVWYKIRTPWRFIGSAAVVIGNHAILSADYEYVDNKSMQIKDEYGTAWPDATDLMKSTLKATHVMRVGGEYRINNHWSLRAGYNYQTTAAQDWVVDGKDYVDVGGCNPSYTFDNKVQNITAGFGYSYKNMYFNMAYVHKNRKSTYNAFPLDDNGLNVKWDVDEHDNKVSATLGFRF